MTYQVYIKNNEIHVKEESGNMLIYDSNISLDLLEAKKVLSLIKQGEDVLEVLKERDNVLTFGEVEKSFENTTIETELIKNPSNAKTLWGSVNPVLYKGKNLLYCLEEVQSILIEKLKSAFSFKIDGKEVYFGYIEGEDTFVAGFDFTTKEVGLSTILEKSGIAYFKLNSGFELIGLEKGETNFYSGDKSGFKSLKKEFGKQLFDIRTD